MAGVMRVSTYIVSLALCLSDGRNLNKFQSLSRVLREVPDLNTSCSFDLEVNNGSGKFSIIASSSFNQGLSEVYKQTPV